MAELAGSQELLKESYPRKNPHATAAKAMLTSIRDPVEHGRFLRVYRQEGGEDVDEAGVRRLAPLRAAGGARASRAAAARQKLKEERT